MWEQCFGVPTVSDWKFKNVKATTKVRLLVLGPLINNIFECCMNVSIGQQTVTSQSLSYDVNFAYLPSATKLRRLCFYRHVSVHMGGCLPQCMLGYHTPQEQNPPGSRQPPWSRHPPRADTPGADTPQEQTPPRVDTPPLSDGHCCGWYASYWNAFLFLNELEFSPLETGSYKLSPLTHHIRSRVHLVGSNDIMRIQMTSLESPISSQTKEVVCKCWLESAMPSALRDVLYPSLTPSHVTCRYPVTFSKGGIPLPTICTLRVLSTFFLSAECDVSCASQVNQSTMTVYFFNRGGNCSNLSVSYNRLSLSESDKRF